MRTRLILSERSESYVSELQTSEAPYQINIDLGMAKWSRTYEKFPRQKFQGFFRGREGSGLALGWLTTVTDSLAAMNDADRLVCDELHRAERVGLQFHDGLFEAWTRLTRWTRPLVRRPRRRAVRSLGGDGGDWFGLRWHR